MLTQKIDILKPKETAPTTGAGTDTVCNIRKTQTLEASVLNLLPSGIISASVKLRCISGLRFWLSLTLTASVRFVLVRTGCQAPIIEEDLMVIIQRRVAVTEPQAGAEEND